MTQREFERRVKGELNQSAAAARSSRRSAVHRGALLEIVLVVLCVGLVLELTADGSRYFALSRESQVQVTEVQAVAQSVPAPGTTYASAARARHAVRAAHHPHRLAAAHAAAFPHHGSVNVAGHTSRAGVASPVRTAWDDSARRLGANLDGSSVSETADIPSQAFDRAVNWVQSVIEGSFGPLLSNDALAGGAESFGLSMPMLAGAGAFASVLVLCLGVGMTLSARAYRAERAHVYR